MAQNFQSYNPMQVGQGTANVFQSDNQQWGKILANGLNAQKLAEAKLAKAQAGAEDKPANYNPNVTVEAGFFEDLPSNMLDRTTKYMQGKIEKEPVTTRNQAKYQVEGEQAYSRVSNFNKTNKALADQFNQVNTALQNSGNIIDQLALKKNLGKLKKEATAFQSEDIDEYSKGAMGYVQKANNELNAVGNRRVLNAKEQEELIAKKLPQYDKIGKITGRYQDLGTGGIVTNLDGNKDKYVPRERLKATRDIVVNDPELRKSETNQILQGVINAGGNIDDPTALAQSYVTALQQYGYKTENINKEVVAIQDILKNGGDTEDITKHIYESNFIKNQIGKKFDAKIGAESFITDVDKLSPNKGKGGAGGSSSGFIESFEENKKFNDDQTLQIAKSDGYNFSPKKTDNKNVTMSISAGINPQTGEVTNLTNQALVTNGATISYGLKNGMIPIAVGGAKDRNNTGLTRSLELYAKDPVNNKDILDNKFTANGKTYTLKELIDGNMLSVNAYAKVFESSKGGESTEESEKVNEATGRVYSVANQELAWKELNRIGAYDKAIAQRNKMKNILSSITTKTDKKINIATPATAPQGSNPFKKNPITGR